MSRPYAKSPTKNMTGLEVFAHLPETMYKSQSKFVPDLLNYKCLNSILLSMFGWNYKNEIETVNQYTIPIFVPNMLKFLLHTKKVLEPVSN